jgi:hypothetical protein
LLRQRNTIDANEIAELNRLLLHAHFVRILGGHQEKYKAQLDDNSQCAV